MQEINFKAFGYYPVFYTRSSEIEALENINDNSKGEIIPLFTLHCKTNSTLTKSAQTVNKKFGDNYYFIEAPNHQNILNRLSDEDQKIINPYDNFKNWCKYTEQFENAIPVVQTENRMELKQVIKQAIYLENKKGKLAFRIKNSRDIDAVIASVSALDDVNNALIYIDAGYIKNNVNDEVNSALKIINKIKKEIVDPTICAISSSFPKSPATEMNQIASFSQGTILGGSIYQEEISFFSGLYEEHDDILYGDYASIHPSIYDESLGFKGKWSSRIDFLSSDEWFSLRDPKQQGDGYKDVAKHIVNLNILDNTPNCWGKEMINNAANGDVFGKSPSKWISVRANTHITGLIDLYHGFPSEDDGDLELDDL